MQELKEPEQPVLYFTTEPLPPLQPLPDNLINLRCTCNTFTPSLYFPYPLPPLPPDVPLPDEDPYKNIMSHIVCK